MLVGARFLAAAAAALALSLGCAVPVSLVSRGEAFVTGNTTYDDFFVAVRQVRSEAVTLFNNVTLANPASEGGVPGTPTTNAGRNNGTAAGGSDPRRNFQFAVKFQF